MTITAHVYERNALVTLSKYGLEPSIQTSWTQFFMIVPCTTDAGEFDIDFIGTMASLMETGVTEVAETGGYTHGSIILQGGMTFVAGGIQPSVLSIGNYNIYSGADYSARHLPNSYTLQNLGYGAILAAQAANRIYRNSNAQYSYRSLVLAWTMAQYMTNANGAARYSDSYPIAMFDMGGLATTGTYWPLTLDSRWNDQSNNPTSTVRWTLA
jgi:hypothetical protein